MNPELPEPSSPPSPAEVALVTALQGEPLPDPASEQERQGRLQSAMRAHTATHDVGDFMCHRLMGALGQVLLTLWRLVTGSAAIPPADSEDKNRDDQ